MYFPDGHADEPTGGVPNPSIWYFQRKMDIVNKKHFLDYYSKLNFHLDGDLTRGAVIACIIRFYNSKNLTELPLVENSKNEKHSVPG